MRCLCYEDCVCGTPVINIDPNVEAFAHRIRLNELQRVNKRLEFLRLEGDLPARRGNGSERPTGLRYLLWELLIILGPMSGSPSIASLERVCNAQFLPLTPWSDSLTGPRATERRNLHPYYLPFFPLLPNQRFTTTPSLSCRRLQPGAPSRRLLLPLHHRELSPLPSKHPHPTHQRCPSGWI
jgi:hypothetical protein